MSDAVKPAKTREAKSPTEPPKTEAGADTSKPVDAVVKPLREEQIKTLKSTQFGELGQFYEHMTATMPAGWAFEDALKPGFWTNVIHMLQKNQMTGGRDRSGSIIELRTEDHAFYALLYVRAILTRGAIVQCIGPAFDPKTGKACPVDLSTGLPWTGETALLVKDFEIKWNRDKRGFDIMRTSDQQIVADAANFPTREMAIEWLSKTAKAA